MPSSKPILGVNDLQSQFPDIAKEWHPIKNGILTPSNVKTGSHKIVWWQCSKYPDHEWYSTVKDRGIRSSSCPICQGRKVLEGFNDLKTTEPEIAKEWHPIRNGDLKPTEVTRSINIKVWWQCSKYPDHEWDSVIGNRFNGRGSPVCADHGFNPEKDAWFYLMGKPGEQQLGITNDKQTRIKKHESNGWNLIEHTLVPSKGQKVLDTEKHLRNG